jgi:hypothetical protein
MLILPTRIVRARGGPPVFGREFPGRETMAPWGLISTIKSKTTYRSREFCEVKVEEFVSTPN